ncbi:MAG: quinone oxidoreductase [Myxococcota bacterium]|jgi:NADPH:quinone reductase|nr:quinone oxidoreductase [Myxococcota bacterium]
MPRAIRFDRTGGPEVLYLAEVGSEAPGPGQVQIRQRAIGVNFIDVYHRNGLYAVPGLPSGLGNEAAGVVTAVGPGVSEFKPGDRVGYGGSAPGAYAEQRVMPADRLVPLPEGISDELAAAILLKGMTVEALVERTVPVRSGDTVLVHAAAGGVGLLLCQWLSNRGVRVIGTVSTEQKAELALAHGADEIVIGHDDFVARVRELTGGRGVRIAYDSIGRTTVPGSIECLAVRGALIAYGNASGKPEPIDVLTLAKGSLFVTRPVLFHYIAERSELLASARAVFDGVLSGVLRVHIGQRFALADAAKAHGALESRRTSGATVLLP